MKIVVCDDDALVYEQMKNIIASYSIVKNENLELTFLPNRRGIATRKA